MVWREELDGCDGTDDLEIGKHDSESHSNVPMIQRFQMIDFNLSKIGFNFLVSIDNMIENYIIITRTKLTTANPAA